MSLFPAYAVEIASLENNESTSGWLSNTTFSATDALKVHNLHHQRLHATDSSDGSEVSHTLVKSGDLGKSEHRVYVATDDSSDSEKETRHHKASHKHKKKKKKHKIKKSKHRSKKKHHDSDQEKEPAHATLSSLGTNTSKIFIEDIPNLKPEHAFHIDRIADRQNYTYQSLYSQNIAQHTHLTSYCLAPKGTLPVTVQDDSHKYKKKTKLNRYYLQKGKAQNNEQLEEEFPTMVHEVIRNEPIKVDKKDQLFGDFIPISSEQISNTITPYAGTTVIQCQISELRKTFQNKWGILQGLQHRKSDQENNDMQSQALDSESHPEYIKQKTKAYNERLRIEPHNTDLWLDWINFQGEVYKKSSDFRIGMSQKQADVHHKKESLVFQAKEAIFERAVKENPGNPRLRVEQLEFCSEYWESERLGQEWKQLLFKHPNSLLVWEKYLIFMESRVTTFSVSRLIKAYKKCFTVLKNVLSNKMLSHPPQENTVQLMLDLFTKLCWRLGQAGHMEKATALYQALLEYNLHHPISLTQLGDDQKMELFTAFWESRSTRIGEPSSRGWQHWIDTKGQVEACRPMGNSKLEEEALEEELIKAHPDKWQLWIALEMSRQRCHWLPWRPDSQHGENEDSCEDPERLVFAEDVTFALFLLETNVQRFQLLYSFFTFLGVSNLVEQKYTKELVQSEEIIALEHISQIRSCLGDYNEDLTLGSEHWRELDLRNEFVTNLFLQTLPLFSGSEPMLTLLTLRYIDFLEGKFMEDIKCLCDKKMIKTKVKVLRDTLKQILFEQQSNLLLWQRFAVIEYNLGNLKDSCKVLNNTIKGLCPDLGAIKDGSKQVFAYLLYRTYAEVNLGLLVTNRSSSYGSHVLSNMKIPNPQKASSILVSICESTFSDPADDFKPSPTQLLQCKRYYERTLQAMIGDSHVEMDSDREFLISCTGSGVEHCFVCYQLLVYIVSGLKPAVEAYTGIMDQLQNLEEKLHTEKGTKISTVIFSKMRERISAAHISLMEYHVHHQRAPLSVLREPLQAAIDTFPSQHAFLWRYIRLELSGGFSVSLRQFMSRQCHHAQGPVTWLLSVLAQLTKIHRVQDTALESAALLPETQLPVRDLGLITSLRLWFEQVVSAPTCKYSVLIWIMFLRFETKFGEPESVKAVFYRAAKHCPWAKSVYMTFLSTQPDLKQDIVDIMLEKEIRLHVPPEEVDVLLENPEPDIMDVS